MYIYIYRLTDVQLSSKAFFICPYLILFLSMTLTGCERGICHLRCAPCLSAYDRPWGGKSPVCHPSRGVGGSPGCSHGGAPHFHCSGSQRLHLPLHIQGPLLWVGSSSHINDWVVSLGFITPLGCKQIFPFNFAGWCVRSPGWCWMLLILWWRGCHHLSDRLTLPWTGWL